MNDVIKILFVCHGNICRSTMAEQILLDMVKKRGVEDLFYINSAATSREEIGNPIDYRAKSCLMSHDIDYGNHTAVQLRYDDSAKYDWIICMDDNNVRNSKYMLKDSVIYMKAQDVCRSFKEKSEKARFCKLMNFVNSSADVADPWYSGNFDKAYKDIYSGCKAILDLAL